MHSEGRPENYLAKLTKNSSMLRLRCLERDINLPDKLVSATCIHLSPHSQSPCPVREGGSQLLMLSLNLPKTQIPMYDWGREDFVFQLLMLSPNLPTTQIPYFPGWGRGLDVVTMWDFWWEFSRWTTKFWQNFSPLSCEWK